jgi:intracellular septation protein
MQEAAMRTNTETAKADRGAQEPPWLRPLSEYGPIAVFFTAYVLADLLWATAALMAATVVALGLSLAISRRVPLMPLITAAVVGVFGGLTLILQDETFIKMKPTIVDALFAAFLLGGLAFGRPLLKPLMGWALTMEDQGWRKLTFRFGLFFIAMAALNEAVWRTQSTDFWVSFNVFGLRSPKPRSCSATAWRPRPAPSQHRAPPSGRSKAGPGPRARIERPAFRSQSRGS